MGVWEIELYPSMSFVMGEGKATLVDMYMLAFCHIFLLRKSLVTSGEGLCIVKLTIHGDVHAII